MESPSKTNNLGSDRLHDELSKLAQHSFDDEASLRLRNLTPGNSALRHRAAICILFQGESFLESSVLLTLRSTALPTHAGQVAFPGGSLETLDENDFTKAALRECQEEVGIVASAMRVAGMLPSFPTFTGNFEVVPVLASLSSEISPQLSLSTEVTLAEWVKVSELLHSKKIEERTVSEMQIQAPYFQWGENKMWGLSAWIFDLILKRYAIIEK